MNKRNLRFVFIIPFLAFSLPSRPAIRLPSIIGSHMVLQQESEVNIWGWARPGEKVALNAGWDTTTYFSVGSGGAKWNIKIRTPHAGGPWEITITGDNKIVLEDVMVGEVWLCGGQSNMEWSGRHGLKQVMEEAPNASNKNIRLFYVSKATSPFPQDDCHGRWEVCSPESMMGFSAIGYFFGKQLQSELDIPVGLINDNWGGTPAETWTPRELVMEDEVLSAAAKKLDPNARNWPTQPGDAYNAMIHPIVPFMIAGVIWYQGESNVGTWDSYGSLFTTMIDSWRKAWSKAFPFYYVQIAPYSGYGQNISGVLLRDVQTKCSSHPGTGMVVISDLVDDLKNIHPQNKIDVAKRLANLALSETYHKLGLVYKFPAYKSMKIEKNRIRLFFEQAGSGLVSRNGDPTEFYIAGEDRVFLPAAAKIDGNMVVVMNKNIKNPVAVRFGFSNASIPNLFSREGLPVNLFRTDDWPMNTEAP
ncbi:MAG TPA: sialate O-acetylesterase [Cyclobacteriaceae bacterium]|nr:sialate O-acetylesterase [Cyclobacteriaceae bacterium]